MEEELWRGIRMVYTEEQFRLSTDSMLLAHFAQLPARASVADLGCGAGAVGLLLCGKYPSIALTGIELQPDAAAQAAENAARNALQSRFSVRCGDLRQIKALLPSGSFDCAVSNPPYFPVGSGPVSGASPLALARSEENLSLTQLCTAAAWLLRFGGSFTLVHKPERLVDLFCQLRSCKLEPKRIRFVRHSQTADVNLVLLEARLGGKPGLRYEKDLILFAPDGSETPECREIYHH